MNKTILKLIVGISLSVFTLFVLPVVWKVFKSYSPGSASVLRGYKDGDNFILQKNESETNTWTIFNSSKNVVLTTAISAVGSSGHYDFKVSSTSPPFLNKEHHFKLQRKPFSNEFSCADCGSVAPGLSLPEKWFIQ